MAVTTYKQVSNATGDIASVNALVIQWPAVPNGNTGTPLIFAKCYADRTVQVEGTFGAGGSVSILGSNDGANWEVLTDPLGNALTFTSKGMKAITELPAQIMPSVTAGDGTTSLTVSLAMHSTRL